MSFGLYVLDDDRTPRLMCSRPSDRDGLLHWAKWMSQAEQRGTLTLARDRVGDKELSTVFLGVNLNVSGSKRPLVFETALFGPGGDVNVCGRSATADEALRRHANGLHILRAVMFRKEEPDGN